MQGKVIFIHQHVAQHWKWITKKSCWLISSIDLTQRFEKLGIITIDIIPFLTTSGDIQTIFIFTMIVRVARTPICVIEGNTTVFPNPIFFLQNKVIQIKTGKFQNFSAPQILSEINFGKSWLWKIPILTFLEALNF